jgi:predicted phage terminase large subunit-like protein
LESDEDFKGIFPEKFTRKHLKKLLEQQGPYIFSCQYMNDPVSQENATFKKEWFQYYDETELKGRLLTKFTMVDPAIALEKDSDFTAIVTVGVDEFRNVYILDIRRLKLSPKQIIDNIFEVWHLFEPIMIGIEDVAFQKSLQFSIAEEMNNRHEYLPIKPLRPAGKNKDQRIRGLQPLYANKKVYHSKHVPNIEHLEDELMRFPVGKHDDVIDSLAYMLELNVYPPRRKKTNLGAHRYLYA